MFQRFSLIYNILVIYIISVSINWVQSWTVELDQTGNKENTIAMFLLVQTVHIEVNTWPMLVALVLQKRCNVSRHLGSFGQLIFKFCILSEQTEFC